MLVHRRTRKRVELDHVRASGREREQDESMTEQSQVGLDLGDGPAQVARPVGRPRVRRAGRLDVQGGLVGRARR